MVQRKFNPNIESSIQIQVPTENSIKRNLKPSGKSRNYLEKLKLRDNSPRDEKSNSKSPQKQSVKKEKTFTSSSQRSLRKGKNSGSTPSKTQSRKHFLNPAEEDEQAKNQRRISYIKRLDKTVTEYEYGSTKLKVSIQDGYLAFIGFGKLNKKRKRIRTRGKRRKSSRVSQGNLGWFLQTFRTILGI